MITRQYIAGIFTTPTKYDAGNPPPVMRARREVRIMQLQQEALRHCQRKCGHWFTYGAILGTFLGWAACQ